MGKVNLNSITRKISASRSFKAHSNKIASTVFHEKKNMMMDRFERHEVTQELKGGADSPNYSDTLPGTRGGNLYTYIGFLQGFDPISPVRQLLFSATRMLRMGNPKPQAGKTIKHSFRVYYPSIDDFDPVAPIPWKGGSWIKAVQYGLSGFNSYMYTKWGPPRSGHGVQAKQRNGKMQKIRSGRFKNRPYMSTILNEFRASFKRGRRG